MDEIDLPGGLFGGYDHVDCEVQSCGICHLDPVWLHHLRPDLCFFYIYGKQHVVSSPYYTCAACEELFESGDTDGLIDRRINLDPEMYQGKERVEVVPLVAPMIAAVQASDLGREPY